MPNVKIKAKRTFAAGKQIFYPYAKEPYEVDAEQASNWVKTGHCVIVEDAENEPNEAVNDETNTNVPEEPKTPENEPNEADADEFDAMEYKDLKAAAKEAKIKGYNTMKKEDLIAALKGE
jgi:hypothetical protein